MTAAAAAYASSKDQQSHRPGHPIYQVGRGCCPWERYGRKREDGGRQRVIAASSHRPFQPGMLMLQLVHLPVQVKQVLPIERISLQGQAPLVLDGVEMVTD